MGIWCFVHFQNLISKYNRPFCSTIQNVITFSSNYKQTPKVVKLQLKQHALPFCIHTTKIVPIWSRIQFKMYLNRLKLHYRSSFHASELQKCNVWYLGFFLCVWFFLVEFLREVVFFFTSSFFSLFLFGIKLFAKCSSIVIEISYGL